MWRGGKVIQNIIDMNEYDALTVGIKKKTKEKERESKNEVFGKNTLFSLKTKTKKKRNKNKQSLHKQKKTTRHKKFFYAAFDTKKMVS